MKRRQAIQSILGLPALTALSRPGMARSGMAHSGLAPDGVAMAPAAATARTIEEFPKLTVVSTEAVADPAPTYLTPPQFAALRKLGDLVVPASSGRPGASQANAAEFLDFLLAQSPSNRQELYGDGLDRLQADAHRLHGKAFEDLTASEAGALLKPLGEPWTYRDATDPHARFLRAAKADLLEATVNSREFIAAQASHGRRAGGLNTYWYTIE
ncbi:MAG: gluconate 2-dehydrogenase subunit 3 family protein [Bryobacteraceae bacterium]